MSGDVSSENGTCRTGSGIRAGINRRCIEMQIAEFRLRHGLQRRMRKWVTPPMAQPVIMGFTPAAKQKQPAGEITPQLRGRVKEIV